MASFEVVVQVQEAPCRWGFRFGGVRDLGWFRHFVGGSLWSFGVRVLAVWGLARVFYFFLGGGGGG